MSDYNTDINDTNNMGVGNHASVSSGAYYIEVGDLQDQQTMVLVNERDDYFRYGITHDIKVSQASRLWL